MFIRFFWKTGQNLRRPLVKALLTVMCFIPRSIRLENGEHKMIASNYTLIMPDLYAFFFLEEIFIYIFVSLSLMGLVSCTDGRQIVCACLHYPRGRGQLSTVELLPEWKVGRMGIIRINMIYVPENQYYAYRIGARTMCIW